MYKHAYLPVDGSPAADRAARLGIAIAARAGAGRVTIATADPGAALTERRRRLAAALPPDLRPAAGPQPADGPAGSSAGDQAPRAEAQAKELAAVARSLGMEAEVHALSGWPVEALAVDADASGADLACLSAVGAGADGRPLGSTVERLARRLRIDTLVLRPPEPAGPGAGPGDGLGSGPGEGMEPPVDSGGIVTCIDGSTRSYGGLQAALLLGRSFDLKVEALGVYDPYLHYTLFNGIVGVLSEKASKVFKFQDQEKLHEEIIDTGLAKIYQAHLEVARTVAREEGADLKITLLDGKGQQKILKHVRERSPWLVVLGRIGVHSADTMDVGATAENVLRAAPCHVLLSSRTHVPRLDIRAEESVQWVPEALAKMDRVPAFVRGVARTAIIRWAMERGHSVITPKVINSAMGDLLPAGAAQAMGYVAEEAAIAIDGLDRGRTFICRTCGYSTRDYRPTACSVCRAQGTEFEQVDRQVLESLGNLGEGALSTEETFDGHRLTWTAEAKDVLRRVPNGYERRRSKARIEKTAKVRGLATVSREFAIDMVEQEVAEGSYLSEKGDRLAVEVPAEEGPDDAVARPREGSPMAWTDAAWKRLCRVPEGFMRDMTREKVEEFVGAAARDQVDLAACEAGIAEGRRMMAEMIGRYRTGGEARTGGAGRATGPAEPAAGEPG